MLSRMPLMTLFNRYQDKCLNILNSSLVWNYEKLPNNTLKLQIAKFCEECDEVIEADNYQRQVEELSDVLITIGGIARFDTELAKQSFNEFIFCVDKYIFMDVIDYAEQKIKILYERDYSNGFRHKETIQ